MLVALFAIPMLIAGFGKERFGLLAIIWMGVGYFSLFDMGFGRALTKLVAQRLGSGNTVDLGPLIWTALSMIFTFGLAGAAIIGLGAGYLVHDVLNVKTSLQAEGVAAFRVLAVGLPAVVVTAAIIGLLQAHQRFATITAVRIPLGILSFAGPLLILQFTPSLVWATMALVASRLLAFAVYFHAAASVCSELMRPRLPNRLHVFPLFQFGAWLTVTNIVSPLMVRFDRFLIGTIISMTAVTYYTTPFEVLSRMQIVPSSIMNVLFPTFTTAMTSDKKRLLSIYTRATWVLLLLVLPIVSAAFLLAPECLQLWLGNDFRQMATPVVRWLAVGWLVNTLARMPFTVLQSAGRPDLVAKTHLLELIPYVLLLWTLTQQFGISGTSAAWFFRVLADTIILNWLARNEVPELRGIVARVMGWIVVLLTGFAVSSMLTSLALRIFLLLSLSVLSAAFLLMTIKPLISGYASKSGKTPVTETSL